MRTFSAAVNTALSSDYVEYFFLIKIDLPSGPYLTTTHPSNITVGADVYLGNGVIMGYDNPKKSSVVDRETFKISFIDPGDEFLTEMKNGVIGRDVEIRAGFVGASGPLTEANDLVYVYSGFLDTPTIQTDFGSKIVSFECSSPMADLDLVKPIYTTAYGMDQINSSDTAFDRINDGYDMQIKWGKI